MMTVKKRSIIIFILSIFLVCSIPYSSLDVVDVHSREVYISRVFFKTCSFEMKWIHSVELTPWSETFDIVDEDIILTQTRFKSFGAGVPDSIGTTSKIIDDYVVFSGIDKTMSNLVYGISPEAKHVLTITTFNATYYALYEFLEPDTPIEFKVTKASILARIIKRTL